IAPGYLKLLICHQRFSIHSKIEPNRPVIELCGSKAEAILMYLLPLMEKGIGYNLQSLVFDYQ
ncbi:MAG TPA: hypothetical protein V6D06_16975, partial [Trichocoleus sp.]